MEPKDRPPKILVLAGVALLMTLVVPVLAAPALAATPNPNDAPMQWAYGASHYRNATATLTNGEYHVAAFFGWTVVYTLTNTSNTTFELEAQRTLAVGYAAQLCSPSCAHATGTLNVSIRGIERETGFSNFTILGSVSENGTAVPALGLTDSHALGSAYLNESMSGARTGLGRTLSFGTSLSVSARAQAQVGFTGSLGLIPWNVAPGVNWTSAARYDGSGAFAVQYAWSVFGNNGSGPVSVNGSGSPSGQVNASGTIALAGTDLGNVTLANGASSPVLVLVWTGGPFEGLDGVILIPRAYEVLGGHGHDWDAHSEGLQTVATSRVDAALDLTHHRFRVAAAASTYTGADSLSTSSATVATARPSAASSPSSETSLVQAQPESVSAAQATAGCLSTGCPGPSGGASAANRLLPLLAVGLVAVALVGVIGAVEVRRIRARRLATQQQLAGVAPIYGPVPPVGAMEAAPMPPPPSSPGPSFPPSPPPPY